MWRAGTWRSPAPPADFFAAKGVLEGLLGSLGVPFELEPGERPFLHPGRSASILVGDDRKAGWIGELHPLVARAFELEGCAAFEVDADLLAEEAPGVAAFQALAAFPAALEDIAVVVAEDVQADEVLAAVRDGGGDLLEAASVFDVYRGEQVGEGRKSLALRLTFRAPDRTLTDEEVAVVRARIEERLADAVQGSLRA